MFSCRPIDSAGSIGKALIAAVIKGINLSYACHYKKKYKHAEHFRQGRYKSIIVAENEYLPGCGSYVELNSVRAHMLKEPEEHR